MKTRFSSNPRMRNLLVACGVVFPDIEFKSRSQEIIPEIVYDCKTEDITAYVNSMFDYWVKRQHRELAKLSLNDVKDIVDYLRGEFVFIPTLSSRLDEVEKDLLRLTREQSRIMMALEGNSHLLIEGGAGTGKTLLATDFARRKASLEERVLYLTFNKNLSNNINNQLDEKKNLKIINIHALFGEYITVDVKKMQQNPQKYFGNG